MLLKSKSFMYKFANSFARFSCASYLIAFVVMGGTVAAQAELTQVCADASTEYIIGGKSLQGDQSLAQVNSKCLVTPSNEVVASKAVLANKTAKTLKLDKTVKLDREVSNTALKVNLYDKRTTEDRYFILNAELRKAISLKDELSKKKGSGQAVDEQQLSRLDADIAALKNELAR
jgi:hypothetical protein